MHRLIQATVLGRLDHSQRTRSFELVLDTIDDFFPDYDDSDRLINAWAECKLSLPHVLRLTEMLSPIVPHSLPIYVKLGELFERASW